MRAFTHPAARLSGEKPVDRRLCVNKVPSVSPDHPVLRKINKHGAQLKLPGGREQTCPLCKFTQRIPEPVHKQLHSPVRGVQERQEQPE